MEADHDQSVPAASCRRRDVGYRKSVASYLKVLPYSLNCFPTHFMRLRCEQRAFGDRMSPLRGLCVRISPTGAGRYQSVPAASCRDLTSADKRLIFRKGGRDVPVCALSTFQFLRVDQHRTSWSSPLWFLICFHNHAFSPQTGTSVPPAEIDGNADPNHLGAEHLAWRPPGLGNLPVSLDGG